MRIGIGLLLGLMILPCPFGRGDDKSKDSIRFGVPLDLAIYPQSKPSDAMASVLKAIDNKRLDYLAAQLADPAFIDARVKVFGGRFQDQVDDLRARLDPSTVKLLNQYARDGEWRLADKEAMLSIKDVKDRFVFFHKIGGRWFMDHRSRSIAKAPSEK